jgi:hypothetical protein
MAMVNRSAFLIVLAAAVPWSWAAPAPLSFTASGHTNYGDWSATVRVSPAAWKPGDVVAIDATLKVTLQHLKNLAAAGIKADSFLMLATAERTFDYGGHMRLPSDQYMSTLITPTGLPLEGGPQGAVTNRFGGPYRTPFDQFVKQPLAVAGLVPGDSRVALHATQQMPADLPPGIYRLRLDFGVARGAANYSLNGDGFASVPFFRGIQPDSNVYSPPILADGTTVSGQQVTAANIKPRVPWVLLYNYNSNGYKGVVADEDQPYFAISPRVLIHDDIILPRYDASNKAITYSLEPQFLADTIDGCWNIPWNYASGEISVEVTKPDGSTVSLGKFPFLKQSGNGPTTGKSALTAWTPPAYGQYAVKATGWIQDVWGNRYEGGGAFRFWIAKRMTLATATFQGMPYPVGSTYGRDVAFAPPLPADVTVTASLYPDSDPAKAQTVTWSGKANAAGVYGAAQGAKTLALSAQGEYCSHILATYTDQDGHLWVSTMRHAGVVFDPNGPIVAHGKKLYINGQYVERGNTYDEGYINTATDAEHLIHLNFPYNAGDVLLVSSDGQGADKIIPTMTYDLKVNPSRSDANLNGIGITNLQLKTSNGYSPHMFPEFITDWAYYYGAAARPGFVSRFVVGETSIRAPYWPLSPNTFGGQINASGNGDMVGDIYRLLGGVVLRQAGAAPAYAGYIASAFMLPQGTNNNRVIAPGSEDLTASTGQHGRVFLVGPRPGMTYPLGTTFGAALQIDPIVPTNITFKLTYPDGRKVQTSGTSDIYGSFAGKDKWVLDTPGIYQYTIDADWNGYAAIMPGLPVSGGQLFVIEPTPAGAPGIQVTVPDGTTFDPVAGIHITGLSTAAKIQYAAVMPGAVLDQGEINVVNGAFDYYFNPADLHTRAQTYDVTNRVSGKPELGDVVHLSLFSQEKLPNGSTYHAFLRVVVRGNQVRVAK